MLTRKQHQLLLYIDSHLKRTGFSPSFDEMKNALDLRSKSGIHRLISALEERGFLRRHHHRARALEVLRLPNVGSVGVPEISNVIHNDFKPSAAPPAHQIQSAAIVSLPLYGRIAAGLPIEALRDVSARIDVPASMLSNGEYYALEVAGDSMIEAGILDGDTAIIRRGDIAETGQIIVALIDGDEVTLKRLRRRGDTIALEPANSAYETRIVPADQVRIQGTLAGLYRRYE
ncbi:transcriptional repressor LexA [Brytella acorum]|uniref:LexA repressor n=1 Tax=Brytella acorum TaxID=2959299 RepID=A0AA35VAM6_9PROT|nr:transcriptional repressor LexA [Brytella acorum]MDF3623892.1 transcriptional repressor LexA [Brytella acorum]CAI9120808.1 transcriptional repressor LexA [Brytella acorum]